MRCPSLKKNRDRHFRFMDRHWVCYVNWFLGRTTPLSEQHKCCFRTFWSDGIGWFPFSGCQCLSSSFCDVGLGMVLGGGGMLIVQPFSPPQTWLCGPQICFALLPLPKFCQGMRKQRPCQSSHHFQCFCHCSLKQRGGRGVCCLTSDPRQSRELLSTQCWADREKKQKKNRRWALCAFMLGPRSEPMAMLQVRFAFFLAFSPATLAAYSRDKVKAGRGSQVLFPEATLIVFST